MAKPTQTDIAASFPEAVAFAKALREAFGEDTKLIYARNKAGETIGRPERQSPTHTVI